MRTMTRGALVGAVAGAVAVGIGIVAFAGPPIICFPFEVGDAQTLPWGNDRLTPASGYDRKKLVAQTVGLLEKEDSTLVRMETIRRASMYVDRDPRSGLELLNRLCCRAMNAEAANKPDADAWYDAAFLVGCFNEMGLRIEVPVRDGGVPGYTWALRALEIDHANGVADPAKQLGAALMVHPIMHKMKRDRYARHLSAAIDSAEPGSIEEASILAELKRWDETPESIRSRAERADVGGGR